MTTPTNYPILKDKSGKPAFIVLPWEDYQRLTKPQDATHYVPSAVVDLVIDNNWSALRAWREHLGYTQSEIAARLGISQSAYSQHESRATLRAATREKMAAALGIHAEQLHF